MHASQNIKNVSSLTTTDIRAAKGVRKLSMLTAYDFFFAQVLDEAFVDILLVGDSLGMVMLGRADTVGVTLDEMIHHTKAVVAGAKRALVIADMPFMTYERGVDCALTNAARLVQESGVRAVKLEGGSFIIPQVKALVASGIAVVGHLGLTPQRAATLGGFKVQAKTASAADLLLEEALALQKAGCFALVLEAVPSEVATYVTKQLAIPTIGIGAGNGCDGQVLVLHDMLGLNTRHVPKFVKMYANLAKVTKDAVANYVEDVQSGAFPDAAHSFSMPKEELEFLKKS